jgi:hypothetical protein
LFSLGLFRRLKFFGFLVRLALRFLFHPALPLFNLAPLGFFLEARFLDFALALLDIFALPCLEERARARVHLARRQLAQHLLRPLFGPAFRRGLLKCAMLWLGRSRFGFLRLRFFHQAMNRVPFALRLDKNGFGTPMAEVLADVALLHGPLHIQRHGLPAGYRFVVRFFRFAHSLPWRGEVFALTPAQ